MLRVLCIQQSIRRRSGRWHHYRALYDTQRRGRHARDFSTARQRADRRHSVLLRQGIHLLVIFSLNVYSETLDKLWSFPLELKSCKPLSCFLTKYFNMS